MPTRKKKAEPKIDLDAPLSPEADKYLAAATAEFNTKQAALRKDWRLDSYKQWGFDQFSGVLNLDFKNGAQFSADGQILGSYSADGHSWEWAWNNPNVEAAMTRDSKLVKKVGKRFGIGYLVAGMIPAPGEEFVSYLCAIGIKATDSIGVFRGKAGPIDVMITLKNARWTKKAASPRK
ncbi:MAG: hypothetical protein K0Q55_2749 [Verrucomicrobia bacterium]|jgi:hypothetical protein|nr:hypothetical protein [Verrucomicrobiota bacterium]